MTTTEIVSMSKVQQPGHIALSGTYIVLGPAKCELLIGEGVAVVLITAGEHMPVKHVGS